MSSLDTDAAYPIHCKHIEAHLQKHRDGLVPYIAPEGKLFWPILTLHTTIGKATGEGCKGCAADADTYHPKLTTCTHLPPCGDRVWMPDTPEGRAAFLAQRMTT